MPRVWTVPVSWKEGSRFLLIGSVSLLLAGYWLLSVSAQSVSSPRIVKIAAGGDPTPIGGVFANDGTPALGLGVHSLASTETVFYAIVVDRLLSRAEASQPINPDAPPPPLRLGIFRASGGKTSKVITTGDPAPSGGKFVALYPPATNLSGNVAFGAIVQKDDNSLEERTFLAAQGSIVAVAAARKLEGHTEASVLSPTLSDSGEVVAKVPQQGDSSRGEIVRSTKTSASKIVGADTLSPTGQRLSLATADNSPPAVSGNGDVIFRSDEGIFRVSNTGTLTKIVGLGDVTVTGQKVQAFAPPQVNMRGDIVFAAFLGPDSKQVTQAIVLVSKNTLTPIVRSGQTTPLGDAYAFVGSPMVNDRGEVVFNATTNGPLRVKGLFPVTAGIFVVSRGQSIKVAASGDPTPIGGVFLSSFGSPVIDNTGTIRFTGIIDLDGDGNPDNQGIFAAQIGGA